MCQVANQIPCTSTFANVVKISNFKFPRGGANLLPQSKTKKKQKNNTQNNNNKLTK